MHYISLRIAGEKLDFDSISCTLEMENPMCHKKGDIHEYNGEKHVFKEDIWQVRTEVENDKYLEKAIEKFISHMDKHSSYINKLSLDNDISFWVTIYPEDVQLNLRLSNSIIKKLYEMGITFDLSIMNLNEFYKS